MNVINLNYYFSLVQTYKKNNYIFTYSGIQLFILLVILFSFNIFYILILSSITKSQTFPVLEDEFPNASLATSLQSRVRDRLVLKLHLHGDSSIEGKEGNQGDIFGGIGSC
jgi:hypothetical protein